MALGAAAVIAWLPAASAQPPAPETLSSPIPRGAIDPQAPVRPLDETLRELQAQRLAAPALERYEAGDYIAAARAGLKALEDSHDPRLRLAVANSLAWTGQYEEADAQYRRLLGSPHDVAARVGLANVLRWRGQAHRAEPFYLEALARDPANPDAKEGLALAERELRPAFTVRVNRTEDNVLRRDELALSYRRWSADRRLRVEAGVLGSNESTAGGSLSARGIFGSARAPLAWLTPRIDAAYYGSARRGARLFGTLHVHPVADRLGARIGRVDWGRTAFSHAASADGLTARLAGLTGDAASGIGALHGRLDLYAVSDGNRVLDGEARLVPLWQPLPWRVTVSGGVYARVAEREDPRYWSPDRGYAVGFAGLQRSWSFGRGELAASIRRGVALSQSAGDTWSASLDGRVWLARDLALGVEAWSVNAPRPGRYRMNHLSAFLQHLL